MKTLILSLPCMLVFANTACGVDTLEEERKKSENSVRVFQQLKKSSALLQQSDNASEPFMHHSGQSLYTVYYSDSTKTVEIGWKNFGHCGEQYDIGIHSSYFTREWVNCSIASDREGKNGTASTCITTEREPETQLDSGCYASLCFSDSDCHCEFALSANCNINNLCEYTYPSHPIPPGGGSGTGCGSAICQFDSDCSCKMARYSWCNDSGMCVFE